jgi:spore coat protein A, manganese oxidase
MKKTPYITGILAMLLAIACNQTNQTTPDLPDSLPNLPTEQSSSIPTYQLTDPNRNIDAGITLSTTPGNFVPYQDALPIMPEVQPSSKKTDSYDLTLSEFSQYLGLRDANGRPLQTTVWGYNNSFPGPTFRVQQDNPIRVNWINQLPQTHLLGVDRSLHGNNNGEPEVRAVTHQHGGINTPEDDGNPMAWTTPGQTDHFNYTNAQNPGSYWYHDHTMGNTRTNIAAGLEGAYIVEDKKDKLRFPKGEFDVPLVVADRSFDANGQIVYAGAKQWEPEYLGDRVLVNGMVSPYQDVKKASYVYRFINGSNARFYRLKLIDQRGTQHPLVVLGSDGSYSPFLSWNLLSSPGERFDLSLNFRYYASLGVTSLRLTNDAPGPYPMGDAPTASLQEVLEFRLPEKKVKNIKNDEPLFLPTWTAPIYGLDLNVPIRTLKLQEDLDANGDPIRLNIDGLGYHDPVTEVVRLNQPEIWEFVNTTADSHPIHLHEDAFKVLSRRAFDTVKYEATNQVVYTEAARLAEPSEYGSKDTVKVNPGEVTRIYVKFTHFTGDFVWHCHILEHEDNDMMRPLRIVP